MSEYSKDENHGSVDNLSSLSVLAQTAAAHEQYAPHADATPANEVVIRRISCCAMYRCLFLPVLTLCYHYPMDVST